MEIKVTDDKNGNVNTTIIECVNDTKWNTPRKIRPIIEQTEPKLNVQRKGKLRFLKISFNLLIFDFFY